MIINKYFLVCLLTIVVSLPAIAKVECTPFETVDKTAETCEDNGKFLKAGQECMQKLESVISTKTNVTIDKLRKMTPNEFKKKKLSNADKNQLLSAAKHVKKTLRQYKVNLFYPEDFDAPEEAIGNSAEFIYSQTCYSDNLARLEELETISTAYVTIFK